MRPLIVLLAACSSSSTPPPPAKPVGERLERGHPVEKPLAPRESHRYGVALSAGQVARGVVMQKLRELYQFHELPNELAVHVGLATAF